MKETTLIYSKVFNRSPISPWVGVPFYLYGQTNDPTKDFSIAVRFEHPIDSVRGPWCQLKVHFNKVNLVFSLPVELDHFIEIFEQNPLPTGNKLYKNHIIGRPRNHWLATLPKEAKPQAFRKELINYLNSCKDVKSFREFYQNRDIPISHADLYSTRAEAQLAIDSMPNS